MDIKVLQIKNLEIKETQNGVIISHGYNQVLVEFPEKNEKSALRVQIVNDKKQPRENVQIFDDSIVIDIRKNSQIPVGM